MYNINKMLVKTVYSIARADILFINIKEGSIMGSRYKNISPEIKSKMLEDYFGLFMSISENYPDLISIKGNILLNKILPYKARSTKDLDMDIVMKKESYEENIVPYLVDFAEYLIVQERATSYKLREVKDDLTMGGIIIYNESAENKAISYSVDINLREELVGVCKYDIRGVEFLGNSVDKILSDKISTSLSNKRYRRIKDFYDIFILMNSDIRINVDRVVEIINEVHGEDAAFGMLDGFPFTPEEILKLQHAWGK